MKALNRFRSRAHGRPSRVPSRAVASRWVSAAMRAGVELPRSSVRCATVSPCRPGGGLVENDRLAEALCSTAGGEVDFANEDQTGLVWTWLDHARDESVIVPGAVLILRDGEEFAMGQVVDVAEQDQGTLVHLRLLPGAVEDYHAAFERATPRSA